MAIAGSDPSGAAGLQADIRTITMLDGYAMATVTAVTVQNTAGVTRIEVMPPALVAAQIRACVDDIGVDAVKIGMLGSAAVASAVADALQGIGAPIVLDPVMVATSGGVLANDETIAALDRLIGMAMLVTPNLPELAALGGEDSLRARCRNVLVKGGHGAGDDISDRLIASDGEHVFSHPRIATRHTHGTGCTLASAIAVGLGEGMALPEAVGRAIDYVQSAIANAPGFGDGAGPLGLGRVVR